MPILNTAEFGAWPYEEDQVYQFESGLPGFEDQHRFLLGQPASLAPLYVLQCLDDPVLRFYALSVPQLALDYRLSLTAEQQEELGLAAGAEPDVCLALLTWRDGETPTINMLAPVVMHTATRRGVQAVQFDSGYECRYRLEAVSEGEKCS